MPHSIAARLSRPRSSVSDAVGTSWVVATDSCSAVRARSWWDRSSKVATPVSLDTTLAASSAVTSPAATGSRTALVLPGQGSQRPGAGVAWRRFPAWSLVDRAGDLLGRDCAHLLLTADADELRATAQAQLATYLMSLVVWRSLPPLDVVVVAGHSLGELTALVVAGVLTPEAGLLLVAERGAAMQQAADAAPGAMAAVLGLSDEVVAEVCAAIEGVWPANSNAPFHLVISGTIKGVAAAGLALREAGARRVLPLPVGGAFHTPLMAPARSRLEV
ncbi:MAG: ACP S-malonyltransferase, partial [Frankiales bacterium]|nr:ACP S-malonyltransferase [Frankiales bacterium]